MTKLRDESGIAMITAILVTLVVVSFSVVSFSLANHDLDQSANERRSVQAIHAAEAGIDRFLDYLAHQAPIGSPACSLPEGQVTLTTSPPAEFNATATYYSDANDPEHTALACPPASIPAAVKIHSVGTSAGRPRTMEAFVGLATNPGGYTLSGAAVFSNGLATWTGQATITNAVGTQLAANLYSNGDLDLKGGGTVYGQVEAQGYINLGGTTDVKNFATSKGPLSVSNNAIVRGNARSTTQGITNGGVISGNAYYCTGSAPGGTVTGSKIPECPNPPGPPSQSFQTFTYVASDWSTKGYAINTYGSCPSAATLNALTGNNVVRVNSTCLFTIPALVLKGNMAIITNGDIRSTGSTSISTVGTPNPPFVLHLMSNVLSSPAVIGGPVCANGAGISMGAGTAFPSGVDVLFYSPCEVSFTGNATASIQGQIIAGGDVKFSSGSNITYKPILIPGTNPNGFGEGLKYRREVSNS